MNIYIALEAKETVDMNIWIKLMVFACILFGVSFLSICISILQSGSSPTVLWGDVPSWLGFIATAFTAYIGNKIREEFKFQEKTKIFYQRADKFYDTWVNLITDYRIQRRGLIALNDWIYDLKEKSNAEIISMIKRNDCPCNCLESKESRKRLDEYLQKPESETLSALYLDQFLDELLTNEVTKPLFRRTVAVWRDFKDTLEREPLFSQNQQLKSMTKNLEYLTLIHKLKHVSWKDKSKAIKRLKESEEEINQAISSLLKDAFRILFEEADQKVHKMRTNSK